MFREIGKHQDLFSFNKISPGSCFYTGDGTIVYNKLIEWMREQQQLRGYNEVLCPNIFNLNLWKTSGHYNNYKENLFIFKVENQGFGMKPMNCPGHCVLFNEKLRSYKDLPLRWAEFGVLHRNEISGALSGLFRVRRFVQDDAHIFCRFEQVVQESLDCLDFCTYVYESAGFKEVVIKLATRPEKYIGTLEEWDKAEKMLEEALNKYGREWKINPGEGVFYGPKIELHIKDALGRLHQIGTVQIDFQLPVRFGLQYRAEEAKKEDEEEQKDEKRTQIFEKDEFCDEKFVWEEKALKLGFEKPVIIHRAILGSIERFMGCLIEHNMGKFPFWLSPRQISIITISEKFNDYAQALYFRLVKDGIYHSHTLLIFNRISCVS